MSRRGKVLDSCKKFEDYNYMIMGVAGVGKTSLAANIGQVVTGSVEGTVVITLGREPIPEHLAGFIYDDYCGTFEELAKAVKEYCDNKSDYPYTKFIALDSVDELFRLAEQYVVKEWNRICKPEDKAKSISQAYKGYQKGENRVVEIVLELIGKIQNAGYKLIFIAHTKKKTISDEYSDISFEQIVCSVDNKYYNCIKDKVNLLATCYFKNIFENVKTVKNAFTKKDMEKGKLIGRKRVIVLDSKNLSIDIKSHWSTIPDEIPLNAKLFVKTIEEGIANESKAIQRRLDMSEEEAHSIIEAIDPNTMIEDTIEPDEDIDDIIEENGVELEDSVSEDDNLDSEDEVTDESEDEIEDIFEDVDTEPIDRDTLAADVKKKFSDIKDKTLKDEVRSKATEYGGITKASIEQLQELMEMMK